MTAAARIATAWFGPQSLTTTPLAATGFSGSQVYLVELFSAGFEAGTRFALKSFHADSSRQHAVWVHALMRHLVAEGIAEVPRLVDCERGGLPGCPTLHVDPAGRLWEMVQWMPGRTVDTPHPDQAVAALETLARVHAAAARLPGSQRLAPAPGQVRRRDQARALLEHPWRHRRRQIAAGGDSAVAARLDEAIAIFSRAGGDRLVAIAAVGEPRPVPLQPVLRDVWSDHVLFTAGTGFAADAGSRVSAIIDYHAAGIDTPATDLARLLGSWQPHVDRRGAMLLEAWREPLAAYERLRSLGTAERRMVPWLDATAVIFGLDNWFHWTLEERRTFADAARVLDRIDRLLARLEGAIEQGLCAAADLD